MRFLRTRDPLEAQMILAVTRRVLELQQRLRQDQAALTANAVGVMLGGKRG